MRSRGHVGRTWAFPYHSSFLLQKVESVEICISGQLTCDIRKPSHSGADCVVRSERRVLSECSELRAVATRGVMKSRRENVQERAVCI